MARNRNNESRFEKEVVFSAEKLGYHCVNLVDEIKRLLPALCSRDRSKAIRQIVEKPYDLFFLSPMGFIALELKHNSTGFTFNFNKVESHQLAGLRDVRKSGGLGYVVVNFKRSLTTLQARKYNRDENLLNRSFALSITTITSLKKAGKKALSLAEMEQYGVEILLEKGIWRLDTLYTHE